jgi:hypothetical protein
MVKVDRNLALYKDDVGPASNGYVKFSVKRTDKSMSATFATMEGHMKKVINFTHTDDGKIGLIASMSQVDQGQNFERQQDSAKASWNEVLSNVVVFRRSGTEQNSIGN